jgi:iron complex transport system ATP-binding protein
MTGLACMDIRVAFGGRTVLDGVSAAFAPGRITAVVGPNGAGKSTLLSCLAGLLKPDGGGVALDETPLPGLSPRERARRIGWLPQTPEIAWAVDVRTFVGLGRTPWTGAWGLGVEDRSAVEAALEATGMTDFADRVITTLSGGERARALLARALAGQPLWLLADEPMAGLDPGHALDAVALFRALAAEGVRGVVVTLHDLDIALRMADRVLVLAGGKVLAEGPPVDALTPAVLAKAYGVEARLLDGVGGPMIEIVGRAA